MDIKKMAELIRAKVHEVDEAGIFDELAESAEREKNRNQTKPTLQKKGNDDRDHS